MSNYTPIYTHIQYTVYTYCFGESKGPKSDGEHCCFMMKDACVGFNHFSEAATARTSKDIVRIFRVSSSWAHFQQAQQ